MKLPVVLFSISILTIPIPSAMAGGSCAQLPSGAVHWWPGDGDATALVGLDGSAQNGVTFGPGEVDQGFLFDGVNDYVDVAHDASLNLPVFTVTAWVFLDRAQKAGEVEMFVSKGSGSSGVGGFIVVYDDRNLDVLGDLFGDAARSATTNAARVEIYAAPAVVGRAWLMDAWDTARFYHLAATFDGAKPVLFLDGVRVDDGNSVAGIAFNTFPLRIGAAGGGSPTQPFGAYEGALDEVQLFDRVLTDCEIRELFEAGTLGACKGDTDGDNVVDYLDNCPFGSNVAQTDADNDSAGDVCDCNDSDPDVFAAPEDIDGWHFPGDTVSWCSASTRNGPGTTYDLLRGGLDALPVGSGLLETCLGDDVTAAQLTDSDPLLSGEGFWYVVRPENACGSGSFGFGSSGTERVSTTCP